MTGHSNHTIVRVFRSIQNVKLRVKLENSWLLCILKLFTPKHWVRINLRTKSCNADTYKFAGFFRLNVTIFKTISIFLDCLDLVYFPKQHMIQVNRKDNKSVISPSINFSLYRCINLSIFSSHLTWYCVNGLNVKVFCPDCVNKQTFPV